LSDVFSKVAKRSAEDIEEHVDRVLKDMGNPEPPLKLEEVRSLLRLNLTYYTKEDLNLLDEIAHQTVMAGNIVMTKARQMRDVIAKVGLKGLLLSKDRQIFIDDEVKDLKKRFVIAHEIAHDVIPWHQALLLGDNEETLSPRCYQKMEVEANYGARRLMFLGGRYQEEALSQEFDWKVVQKLSKRFGNTLSTSLWEQVNCQDVHGPAFGMISRHPIHTEIGARAGDENVAYFITSGKFDLQFSNLGPEDGFGALRSYVTRGKRGPIGEGACVLHDVLGEAHEFHMTSFCNTYDVLTMATYVGPRKLVIGF
jgi:Zn-dependent peptidase ImmA (M78 family)